MDEVRNLAPPGNLGCRRFGRFCVQEVDLVRFQPRMRPVGLVEGERDDAIAAFDQGVRDGGADAAARAGDDRGAVAAHARFSARGTSARTRNGLPDPRRIFSGAATTLGLRIEFEGVESILQPSTAVAPHFQTWQITTTDERVRTGLLVRTYLDESEYIDEKGNRFKVRATEIARTTAARASIMPDGLVDQLTKQEIRDLIAYLQSRR